MGYKSKAFDAAAPGSIEPEGARGAIHRMRHGGRTWKQLTLELAGRALLSPRLAADLARTVWAFRRRGWFRAPPFVPLPPPEYVRWRMYTAYGDENAVPPADDVVRFVRWRRRVMHL